MTKQKTIAKYTNGMVCAALLFIQFETIAQTFKNTVSIFDGKTLDGWFANPGKNQHLWKVENGVLVGGDGINPIAENNYLCTKELFGDFEFRCLFRLSGDPESGFINSGIQYRSLLVDDNMVGYQADIGDGYWGDIYDEHRRGKLVGGQLETLSHILLEDGWNSYIIRCKGKVHELYINGVKTCEYVETDPNIPSRGFIGLQLHSGGHAKVEFRDLTITDLENK